MAKYHRYVFDNEKRTFVGRFEEMYQAENTEGFDSWHERDLRMLRKRLSLEILSQYNFSTVLDIGCGKGTFTHLLKKENNVVLGVDGSATAVERAKQSYPDIEFEQMNAVDLAGLRRKVDLVVVMAVLAYVAEWRLVLRMIADIATWIYVAEYIPPNPIGFVKSDAELVREVEKWFHIRTKVLLDDTHSLILGRNRKEPE